MFKNFPQIISEEICFLCKGCCCFNDIKSVWRPHVIDSEKFIESDNVDSDHYVKAVSEGDCIKCVFLNLEDHKCKVYSSRPIECIIYPFLMIREKDDVKVSVHLSCPHIQEVLNGDKLSIFTDKVKDYFAKEKVKEFIKDNSSLISDYSNHSNEIMSLFSLEL